MTEELREQQSDLTDFASLFSDVILTNGVPCYYGSFFCDLSEHFQTEVANKLPVHECWGTLCKAGAFRHVTDKSGWESGY